MLSKFHPLVIEFSRVKNDAGEQIQFNILNYLSEFLLHPSTFHSHFAFDQSFALSGIHSYLNVALRGRLSPCDP